MKTKTIRNVVMALAANLVLALAAMLMITLVVHAQNLNTYPCSTYRNEIGLASMCVTGCDNGNCTCSGFWIDDPYGAAGMECIVDSGAYPPPAQDVLEYWDVATEYTIGGTYMPPNPCCGCGVDNPTPHIDSWCSPQYDPNCIGG